MAEIIVPRMDGKSSLVVDDGSLIWSDRLMSWEFRPRSPKPMGETPEECGVAVYSGPPRVLEIGCSDGSWCFKIKKEQPDWIVEGIDDTDHWTCVHKGTPLRRVVLWSINSSGILIFHRDFMDEADTNDPTGDYFNKVHASQNNPEFTVRNLNCLLMHENPIPHNLYGLIRARDIFDRVESYKTFLEDVRL